MQDHESKKLDSQRTHYNNQFIMSHFPDHSIQFKGETMKKIFEITKKIADLGFGEKDIHGITTDEEIYIKYEK